MIVTGFKTSAVAAGIKAADRLDVALIVTDRPAAAAAVWTKNTFAAAPLVVSKRHLRKSGNQVRAVLVNSGNANAATGAEGIAAAEACAEAVARELGCPVEEVLVSSTGVIGRPLPVDRILAAIPRLISSLDPANVGLLARAIMTTDTVPKIAGAEAGGTKIVGVAKGAGMIHPDMATMLAFLMTDATIDHSTLDRALRDSADRSFNAISVDGDTSTNDTVLLLANGTSSIRPDTVEFQQKLEAVSIHLAKAIVRDGEGASKFVELLIEGAPTEEAARRVGRTIARSPLVKTALFGADPNWGRIVGAIGNSGVSLASDRIDIYVDDIPFSGGDLEAARKRLSAPEFQLRVVLNSGTASARVWTCDLTHDYIHINADYTT